MDFDFGANWAEFSHHALSAEKVAQAKSDFQGLMAGINLKGKSFLDIGYGQGLSLLIAAEMGAKVVGCDINPLCAQVVSRNIVFFPSLGINLPPLVTGSILDDHVVELLRYLAPGGDQSYEIVHSWGALHHTGNIKKALAHAAKLVKASGFLVLAIYNRHWSSRFWLLVKRIYNFGPNLFRKLMVLTLYPIILLAKILVTRCFPAQQNRGMDFFYDVVDWVGGYPYEYASVAEIESYMTTLGFRCMKLNPARVPTGCNEFVFINDYIESHQLDQ